MAAAPPPPPSYPGATVRHDPHEFQCPLAVRQCTARVPLGTTPNRCGGVLQEFHGPGPKAMRWGTARVPLPTTSR